MVRPFSRVGVLAAFAAFAALFLFPGVAAAAPSNDSVSSPVVLAGPTGSVLGSNVDATFGSDEPWDAYWYDGATVWYAWTAPQSGTLSIYADADWETTHVALYAGAPTPDSVAVASDYYGVDVDVTAGTTYYLAVDTESSIGDFYVDWTFAGAAAAANDMWAFSQPIAGASGGVAGTTVGATAETGEPAGAGHSVWFHWIAPQDGVVSFAADGGQTVTAYTGWNLGELKPLATAAPVAAGDVLSVRVDGATPGAFTLTWQTAAAPAPTLAVPATIVVDADAPQGRTVPFDATATDWKGRTIGVTCSKWSGSVFEIGTTTVVCTATDAGGRTSQASFDVHVRGVSEQLAALRAAVTAAQLDAKTTEKLTAQLDDVAKQVGAGRTTAICGGLDDFVGTLQKQSGKTIPAAQADAFLTSAWRIRAVVDCS